MAGSASSLFHANLNAPPTRATHSQTVMVHPGGGSIQRRILSGVNIASHTSRLGALNVRVRTMVVSVGIKMLRPSAGMGFMVWSLWSGAASSRLLRRLHLIEQRVQCFEAGLPVPAELLGPEHRFLQRRGVEAAEMLPPLDAATDEFGPLQHAHVLGGGGESHSEGRGEFAEVALSAGELPDDRAAGGVRQGVEDEIQPG